MRNDGVTNLQILRGASRVVVLIGRYAFKFPSGSLAAYGTWHGLMNGMQANIQESIFFRAYQHPRLCPVVVSIPFGVCNIMRRAVPYRHIMPDDTFRLFVDAGTFVIPCENKMDSFGYLDGRTVVVDYGN